MPNNESVITETENCEARKKREELTHALETGQIAEPISIAVLIGIGKAALLTAAVSAAGGLLSKARAKHARG